MKKGIDERKVQRMRNLVSGNYNKSVNIRSGYTAKVLKKIEGDVWEERGKTWTIKNGIKQTVNKLDNFRKSLTMPLSCPSCSKNMKWFDKHAYNIFKFCSDCLVRFECEIQKSGKWDEYKKKVQNANFESWLNETKEEFKDFLKQRKSKTMISEAGDIEDWSEGQNDEIFKEKFDSQIKKVKDRRNENNKS